MLEDQKHLKPLSGLSGYAYCWNPTGQSSILETKAKISIRVIVVITVAAGAEFSTLSAPL